MCRLFALHAGVEPVAATFWLIQAPDSLAAQSHRNPDGAGVGAFGPDGIPTVDKQPLAAWQDQAFAAAARTLRSKTFVAHVRYASTGPRTTANTHPFAEDGRIFAHNGIVTDLPAIDARLLTLGATHLVHGDTDSERIFAMVTAETMRCGGDVTAGLTVAVSWISDHVPVYALNLVLASATDLWALRYPGTHELYVLDRPPGGTGTHRPLDARTSRIHASSEHLGSRPSVVVASEPMDDDPAWRLLDSGELLHVDASLRLASSRPFPRTPRRLLRRSDLDPDGASSQHPV
ncbi:MAG: class II glutamine amidotransferase [Dermatophilaceae bacterium]